MKIQAVFIRLHLNWDRREKRKNHLFTGDEHAGTQAHVRSQLQATESSSPVISVEIFAIPLVVNQR